MLSTDTKFVQRYIYIENIAYSTLARRCIAGFNPRGGQGDKCPPKDSATPPSI